MLVPWILAIKYDWQSGIESCRGHQCCGHDHCGYAVLFEWLAVHGKRLWLTTWGPTNSGHVVVPGHPDERSLLTAESSSTTGNSVPLTVSRSVILSLKRGITAPRSNVFRTANDDWPLSLQRTASTAGRNTGWTQLYQRQPFYLQFTSQHILFLPLGRISACFVHTGLAL